MGCLRWLGCLFILLILAATGYVLRDQIPWREAIDWIRGERRVSIEEPAAPAPEWQLLTQEGAARARGAVRRLGEQGAPGTATVAPGDLAAYIFQEATRRLLPSGQDVMAAVIDSQLHIRGIVPSERLLAMLGPEQSTILAGMLPERSEVRFAGTLELIRPGLAQYRMQTLHIGGHNLSRLIPRLIREVERGTRPEGIARDALPMEVPAYIQGVRLANGEVTIYRSTP
jgi:hypothetical protein